MNAAKGESPFVSQPDIEFSWHTLTTNETINKNQDSDDGGKKYQDCDKTVAV